MCLDTVVRVYYRRHSFASYNSLIILFLTFLGNIALKRLIGDEIQTPEVRMVARSTLLMCALGLTSQGQHFHFANMVYSTLREFPQPSDADILKAYTNPDPSMTQYIHSHWPIPIVAEDQDPMGVALGRFIGQDEEAFLEQVAELLFK